MQEISKDDFHNWLRSPVFEAVFSMFNEEMKSDITDMLHLVRSQDANTQEATRKILVTSGQSEVLGRLSNLMYEDLADYYNWETEDDV